MYIHTYQIQNVLNEYRKQLSRGPSSAADMRSQAAKPKDRINISDNGQRQSIIEQVSKDIVDRIKSSDSIMTFRDELTGQLDGHDFLDEYEQDNGNVDLTYTYINDQNQKLTNTFKIQNLNAAIGKSELPDSPPLQQKESGNDAKAAH